MAKRPKLPPVIGIDLMGTERGPESILAACIESFSNRSDVVLAFIGDETLRAYLPSNSLFQFIPSSSVIELTDHPLHTLRRKKDASMAIGIQKLSEQAIDALVSGGNTGALTSLGQIHLTRFPSILRPALASLLPSKKSNSFLVLDVGANLHCTAEHLIQFAHLGAAYQSSRGISKPRLGLLNIGEEKIKGTATLQEAYQRLDRAPSSLFSFVGNIEAKEAFEGKIDILITEGVMGNVFLKTAEGVASFLLDSTLLDPQNTSAFISPFFEQGGIFLGFKELLIKCHSYGAPSSFVASINQAIQWVANCTDYGSFLSLTDPIENQRY